MYWIIGIVLTFYVGLAAWVIIDDWYFHKYGIRGRIK